MPLSNSKTSTFVLSDPEKRKVATRETFAGHKITNVVRQLRDSMAHGKIEAAVHWSAELLVGGNVWTIWESIFTTVASYFYTHRHTCVYVLDRYTRFKTEASQLPDIQLRNSPFIRNIIAEVVAVLACGDGRYKATKPQITDEMFHLTHLKPHLKAKTRDPGRPYILEEDPPEAAMCANELASALQQQRLADANFWTEWLLAWQRRCTKAKQSYECAPRSIEGAPPKHNTTPALLLWHIIAGESKSAPHISTVVDAWQKIFMIKFSTKVNPCRTLLIHAAVYAVCNKDRLVPTRPLSNANLMPKIMDGLPLIYERIADQCGLEIREEKLGTKEVGGSGVRSGNGGSGNDKKAMDLIDDPLLQLMPTRYPGSQ